MGRFLGPNISGHYRRYPLPWTVDAWHKAGIDDVGCAHHEPRRRSRDVGQARRCLRRPRPAYYAARPRRMARLVDGAAPALHGLAPLLRRDRGGARPPRARRPTGGDGARLLPGRGGRRPLPRRAPRPPAAHAHPRPRPGGRHRRVAGRRRGHRRGRRGDGGGDPRPVHRGRARSSSWPTTPSSSAVSCTPTPASPPPGARSRSSPPTWRRPTRCRGPRCSWPLGAFALSWAQRSLSTPARLLRRSVQAVEGTLTLADGTGPAPRRALPPRPPRARPAGHVVGHGDRGRRTGPGPADLAPLTQPR